MFELEKACIEDALINYRENSGDSNPLQAIETVFRLIDKMDLIQERIRSISILYDSYRRDKDDEGEDPATYLHDASLIAKNTAKMIQELTLPPMPCPQQ